MGSKIQLDRDVISEIFRHKIFARNRPQILVSDFKLGLVSKKCFQSLLKTCDEECRSAEIWHFPKQFKVKCELNQFISGIEIPESIFLLLNALHFRELSFGDDNDQEYLQLLCKLKGYGLERIHFDWPLRSTNDWERKIEFSNLEHCSEMLRIISESSTSLKELGHVPDHILERLPQALELEKLSTRLSTEFVMSFNDSLKISAKNVEIYSDQSFYVLSPLLKNINAQTLHLDIKQYLLTEEHDRITVKSQLNPNIQRISLVVHNEPLVIPEKIYDIKLFCEDLFSAYPSLNSLEIQDNYTYDENSSTQTPHDFLHFAAASIIQHEAQLIKMRDMPITIKLTQVFDAPITSYYDGFIKEIDSLREGAWKDFKVVENDSAAYLEDGEHISLMKSIRVTEEKLFEIKIYISEKLEYEDYDSDVQREIRADAGLDDDYHYDDGEYYNGDEDDYDDFYEEDEYGY
uniref:Uncharacterized protein n=1 Tax=Acrobeloides nanus TaxID=290746 RepID=A0A914E7C2_9BILA